MGVQGMIKLALAAHAAERCGDARDAIGDLMEAANPAAILELISEVEYRTEKAREHFDAFQACHEELKAVNAQRDELLGALQGMLAITSDSVGVSGYHLNGAVAEWDEFEEYKHALYVAGKAESAS